MDKFVTDQAEGLRRLLARRPLRVVTMLSAREGAGASTAAVNLAAGLCHLGKRAVVIDEHPASSRVTLDAIVSGRATLENAFSAREDSRDGARISASRHHQADVLDSSNGAAQIAALDGQADLVLIDACLDDAGLSPLAANAHDIIIVMEADAGSLTGAYGLIKRLHFAHASQQFRLLFNRVAQPSDAQGIFHNLSSVAARYLGVSLTPAGVVSRDHDRISRAATLGTSVVSAFPAAPAAIDYRRIAGDMLHWPWRPIAPAGTSLASAMPPRESARPRILDRIPDRIMRQGAAAQPV